MQSSTGEGPEQTLSLSSAAGDDAAYEPGTALVQGTEQFQGSGAEHATLEQQAQRKGEQGGSNVGSDHASGGAHHSNGGLWSGFMQRLSDVGRLLTESIARYVAMLDRWYVRALAVAAFVLALISTVINMVLVPIVNYQLLPAWQATVCSVTMRQVTLGRVHWVSLGGLTGVVPLASIGPVTVGPGPVEKSSGIAPQGIQVYVDPLASIIYKQAVLALSIDMPEVTCVQGDGFSVLGYPDDTTPSSRDFLPGLNTQAATQQAGTGQSPGAGGAASGSSSSSKLRSGPAVRGAAASPAAGRSAGAAGEGELEQQPPVALGRVALRNGRLALLVQVRVWLAVSMCTHACFPPSNTVMWLARSLTYACHPSNMSHASGHANTASQ